MRRLLTILSLVAMVLTLVLLTPTAKAADEITHFYGSAFISMAAGIDRDYAVAMSVGNEMIDRGLWTNPMGLPTPRLLYHFLGTPVDFTLESGEVKKGLAIATIDHPLFYNLLHIGIQKRDPVKLGAAKHLLIDTFFHSGFSNLLGHAEAGHRPDMPYEEVQKARQCFQAIMEIDFLIRDMQTKAPDFTIMKRLVSEALQNEIYATQLKKVTGAHDLESIVAVVSKRPDVFTQIILDNELVRNTFFTNMEKSRQYMKIAMTEIMAVFKKQGYTSFEQKDLPELVAQFKDVAARSDVDAMQTLKIMIYRILQVQDPVLSKNSNQELIKMGFDAKEIRTVVERGQFDFSKLGGFATSESFLTGIENKTRKNADALKMLVANLEIFKNQITVQNSAGQMVQLRPDQWSQTSHTFSEAIAPEVLSWRRLFNQDGQIRLVENRDVGNLVSSQTDTDWIRDLVEANPNYLEDSLKILKVIEANPEQLKVAARLRALAETSYLLANSATKDLFPGKLSPIKKVVYEDDKVMHACFAKSCRVEAVRNLVAEYTNIKLAKGPDGIHTYLINQVKAGLAKVGIKQGIAIADEQAEEISRLTREFNQKIGFGSTDANGNLTLPSERPDLMEVAPNLRMSGYASWHKSSNHYVTRILLKFSKAKNAEIQRYIENGERMKTEVVETLHHAYYSQNADGTLPQAWTDKHGELATDTKKLNRVSGLPSSAVVRCEAFFN